MPQFRALLVGVGLSFGAGAAAAQEPIDGWAESELVHEATVPEMAAQATTIVEGVAVSRRGLWNEAHTRTYTALTIRVYKLFKGRELVAERDVVIASI